MEAFCLNNISTVALNTLKGSDGIVENIDKADSILVRSYEMKDFNLPENILAIARAGAGVNNIPFDNYAEKGVVVFNTPGANANSVKELVLAGLFMASRDLIGGNLWVKNNCADENIAKNAEKAKKEFAGHELYGKTIAVVGLGAIGVLVANACFRLGMEVIGYDPYLSTTNALKLNPHIKYVDNLEAALENSDYITIHVPASEKTKGMINAELIKKIKKNAVILNFSRDTLIDENALKEALEAKNIKKYVTDFANPISVTMPNTIIFPHLGASTDEAEDNCAIMAINELKDYLENGNITNSVNYPSVNGGKARQDGTRICICHKNIPGIIAAFTSAVASNNGNIIEISNKSKGDYAYTLMDINQVIDTETISKLNGVIKVRRI